MITGARSLVINCLVPFQFTFTVKVTNIFPQFVSRSLNHLGSFVHSFFNRTCFGPLNYPSLFARTNERFARDKGLRTDSRRVHPINAFIRPYQSRCMVHFRQVFGCVRASLYACPSFGRNRGNRVRMGDSYEIWTGSCPATTK